MLQDRKYDPETGEPLRVGQSAVFTCLVEEAPVSYFSIPEEYNEDIDLPLVNPQRGNVRFSKPNLHQFPIFRRVRKNPDALSTLEKQKRGQLMGLLQWTSDGEISTFGDDGFFKGTNYKPHAAVLWKYIFYERGSSSSHTRDKSTC